MKISLRRVLLVVSYLLSGCASLRTPWLAPAVPPPGQWNTVTAAVPGERAAWWQNFADPPLDALVEQALRRNNDFAAAALRVRRAQLQAGLADTNRGPSVALGAGVASTHRFDPAATIYASGVTAALSYEADLWGKLASQRAAAHWEAEATAADCQAFGLSLVATAARLYWQLGYLNQRLALAAADIEDAQKTLALARAKHKAGAVSALNVAQAEASLSSQQALRSAAVQQRVETRHALALLLNQAPGAAVVEPAAWSDAPLPAVGADLPAAVLARRPDLHAAELRLRETLAQVDITRASFYPNLSLTGTLGTASAALLSLLSNPAATLGAGLSLPFIQRNTMELSIRVSETAYEEAAIHYRQRLYTALAEVENSLSARTNLIAEEAALRQAMVQAGRAESIARSRFKAGSTDIQPWLNAQAAARNAARAVLGNRWQQLNNQAKLYNALGLGAGAAAVTCG